MAEFQPFHGLRYNTEKVNLADVLAPPYDVIKGKMRDELSAKSTFNIVQVELATYYGEEATDEQYAQCAALLREWKAQGILVRDDPAFYLYEQAFTVPGTDVIKKRRGVLGALLLEEFGEGVQPHEHTLSGPKADRLKLLRATRTNTSPIFGLYQDNDGWVERLLEDVSFEKPIGEATDSDGVTHRLWRITDDETVNAIVAALDDEPLLIADGHHRYETALNYRNERRAEVAKTGKNWTGDEPENYVMMMCVSTSDEGLIVLPTHRLVKAGAHQINHLLDGLQKYFEVEEMPSQPGAPGRASALLEKINAPNAAPRLGLHLKGHTYSLQLKAGNEHLTAMDANRSAAYNALDVSILHTLILEKELAIGADELAAGGHVSYTIDAAEAIQKVDDSEYDAAFILRPTPVEQVQQVAAAGDKMPQKSTYFYPKLVTGLVLRPLD